MEGKQHNLKSLGGLDTPNSGEIFYDDIDISKLSDSKLATLDLKIGCISVFDLLSELTAEENILCLLNLEE